MKTLFLGSSGFVGSALLDVLELDERFTILSRNPISTEYNNARVLHGDINDSETLMRISTLGFERLIDCSWEALPSLSEANNKMNLVSKKSLYKHLLEGGIKEINSFGSCLEYGSLTGLISESARGREVGNFGKVKLEILREVENFGTPFRWFRPFYLIGTKQHENSLLNSAIKSIRLGIDFSPKNPDASFDFIAVEDAVRGVESALKEPACKGIINLGTGQSHSVNEMINIVRRHYGLAELEAGEAPGMRADMHKLTSETGWNPQVPIFQEVTRIILSKEALS